MRFASLGSGSQGNATLVEVDDQLLLIDCGFTIKETERRLALLDCQPQQLTAILVTHEHGDHLKGVPPFARKYRIPVYITPGTYRARKLGELPHLNLIEGYRPFQLGGVSVQPVAVPHDAREPAQFVLEANGRRLGILTDLGTISPHVEQHFNHCDALLLEANHDLTLLAQGPYPPSLKQRVSGAWGHLNNNQSAAFLQRIDQSRLQTLVVGHISQKNNCIEKAKEAISPVSTMVKCVRYACQDQGFDWLDV